MLRNARELAGYVLDEYWEGRGLPVDPVELARALGLSVFTTDLGDDVWAMIVGANSFADIYLDRQLSPVRMRFACAHEIGHFLYSGEGLEANRGFVDRRSKKENQSESELQAEEFADEFALSLLIPEKEIRSVADRDMKQVMELAKRHGVSPSMLLRRLDRMEAD